MRRLLLVLVLATGGCTIDRAGQGAAADAGRRTDAGREPEPDGGVPPIDAPMDARRDAGPRSDAGRPDAGRPDAGPVGCTPVGSRCSADGTARVDCMGDGRETIVPCARGCGASGCRAETDCIFPTTPETVVVPGIHPMPTCGAGDEQNLMTTAECGVTANGDDRVVRFDLDREQRLRFELLDVDPRNEVDPVLYLRQGGCGNSATQVACDDDRASGMLDSLIDITLGPGDYFIVIDSYSSGGTWEYCGDLELRISLLP